MPAPFAIREWDYKGKLVRTVVDDVGGVHFVEGDIRLILESDDHFRKPTGLDRHETGPSSARPRQQTLVGEIRIKTLIRDSRGSEAVPLGEWVESVVIPALHGPDRHEKATRTRDPILSWLKALTGLRASQVARDRHSAALEKAVDRGEDAMYSLTSLSGKRSIDDLVAWCRGKGNVSPDANGSGTTTPSSSGEF